MVILLNCYIAVLLNGYMVILLYCFLYSFTFNLQLHPALLIGVVGTR